MPCAPMITASVTRGSPVGRIAVSVGAVAAAFVVYKLVTLSDALSDGTSSPLEWGWLPLFVSFGLIFWGYLNSPP